MDSRLLREKDIELGVAGEFLYAVKGMAQRR